MTQIPRLHEIDERFARLGALDEQIKHQIYKFSQGPYVDNPLPIHSWDVLDSWRWSLTSWINIHGEGDYVLEMLNDWVTEPYKIWAGYLVEMEG